MRPPDPFARASLWGVWEALFGIAAKYGTTYQRIAEVNHIDNPNLINVAQNLVIE